MSKWEGLFGVWRNTRLRYLGEKEIRKLHDACAEHLKPIVIVALNTGMRKEEMLSLKWKDVDYRIRTISILDTKNGESRELLGHKSFEMTLRYAHLSPEHKKAALDTLCKRLARNPNSQHGETREKYPGQLTED